MGGGLIGAGVTCLYVVLVVFVVVVVVVAVVCLAPCSVL